MKIRNGFVSNSSSSSFILHTNFTPEELKEILDNEDMFYPEISKNQLGRGCFSGWAMMWNGIEDMGEELVAVIKFLEEKYGKNSWMVTTEDE